MRRLQRLVILTRLTQKLDEQGSWCGETHLQKATYFLQELLHVPTEFDFILYKHGPFSFDLRDELTAMRADGLLSLEPRPFPYGPRLVVTTQAKELQQRFSRTLAQHDAEIGFVSEKLGPKGVTDLEKLATALYVTLGGDGQTSRERAQSICGLKPHISMDEATSAVEELDRIRESRPRT